MEDSMNDMQRPAIDLVYDDLLATIEERDAALARVAELETALAAERAAHAWRPVLELPPVGTLCTLRVDAGVFLVDGFNAPSRDYEPVAIRVSGWRDIAHPAPGYSYRLKPAPRRPTAGRWGHKEN